jgi:hypothetical protein
MAALLQGCGFSCPNCVKVMSSRADIWVPRTEAEKQAVQDQLERLLAHPNFRGSKRCTDLLRFIVEYRLRNEEGQLKERVLGAEVFGRNADYDTSEDVIVRHTSSDLRKRIAQYYFESGHQSEIRIELPAGSYLPEFTLPVQNLEAPVAPSSGLVTAEPLPPAISPTDRSRSFRPLLWAISSLVLVALVGGFFLLQLRHRAHEPSQPVSLDSSLTEPAPNLIWKAILDDPSPLLICMEKPQAQIVGAPVNTDYVALWDAVFAMRLASILSRKDKRFEVKLDTSVTPQDLTGGTTVFVGESNSLWMERAMESLRFHLVRSPGTGVIQIEDRKNLSQRDWFVRTLESDWPPKTNIGTPRPGYALVARFMDSKTKHWVVIAAAPGGYSMRAAQDVLLDPKILGNEMARQHQGNWASSNFEAVVKTQLVDGDPGPPAIIALNVW